MRTLLQDLVFGFRLFRTDPWFSFVAVLTLALGIAVNTTVFSWVDGILLRPYPGAANASRLALLEMTTAGAPNGAHQVSYLDYLDYRRNLKSLSGLAVHRDDVFAIGEGTATQVRWGGLVSGNYFSVLGLKPALGRTFTAEEDSARPGAFPVAVISDRLWRQRFRSDPDVIGQSIRVNQRELTVVGVAPPEFRGTMPGLAFDIWIPLTMGRDLGIFDEAALTSRGRRMLYALTLLRPGTTRGEANAEASAFSRRLESMFPATNLGVSASVIPLWRLRSGAADLLLRPLTILMAVSLLLLLIVCANVANLLLARSVSRRRELAIRLALGIGRFRLVRQLFAETLILAIAGTGLSLALTPWASDLLPALVPDVNAPVAIAFRLTGRILIFTAAACAFVTVLAGVVPAFFWMRADVHDALKEGGRGGDARHSHRTRSLLVVSEVALACLALVFAATFLRSFRESASIHPGFDRTNVALARLYVGSSRFTNTDLQQFTVRLQGHLRSLPGVLDVSYADTAPLGSGAGPWETLQPVGYVAGSGESPNVSRSLIGPGYFASLRIPFVSGRDFRDSDDAKAPPVIIVNQAFCLRYFGEGDCLGRVVQRGKRAASVVGVVKDSKYFHVTEAPRPYFYSPFQQRLRPDMQLLVFIRTAADPIARMQEFRREFTAVDARAGAVDLMLLDQWTQVTMLPQLATASLAGAVGVLSLILAAIGLYSVMAYSVTRRTREIGIRMAMGARPLDVIASVMRAGALLTIVGLVCGMAGAFITMRAVGSLLDGIGTGHIGAYAGAGVFLLVVGLLASFFPARRASHVDPVTALRSE